MVKNHTLNSKKIIYEKLTSSQIIALVLFGVFMLAVLVLSIIGSEYKDVHCQRNIFMCSLFGIEYFFKGGTIKFSVLTRLSKVLLDPKFLLLVSLTVIFFIILAKYKKRKEEIKRKNE